MVKVFWDGEKKWFKGQIIEKVTMSKKDVKWKILYTDGDVQDEMEKDLVLIQQSERKDDIKNLSALEAISGKKVTALPQTSRASVRVTTADTLPLMPQIRENIWALTGLGSRGFTFAPLLAESLIANLCGEVGPLDKTLRAKFSTLR